MLQPTGVVGDALGGGVESGGGGISFFMHPFAENPLVIRAGFWHFPFFRNLDAGNGLNMTEQDLEAIAKEVGTNIADVLTALICLFQILQEQPGFDKERFRVAVQQLIAKNPEKKQQTLIWKTVIGDPIEDQIQ